ncbi:MAG: hypothetical protein M3389_13095, partial [Actinomycetota bacterium]|nr:hypothetical protein [Actinomycetota bacterium]
MTPRALVLCLLATLAVAAPAEGAAVIGSETGCEIPPCVVDVTVTDHAGDRNDLSFEVDGNALVVRDAATPLRALHGCERRDDGSVRCAFSRPVEQVQIEAGAQDDVVRTPPWGATLWLRLGDGDDRFEGSGRIDEGAGGPGNDTLKVTGSTRTQLTGGPGDDVLTGGLAGDRLIGETGRDRLVGGPGDDVLDAVDNGDEDEFEQPEVPVPDVVDGGLGR